MIKVTFLGTSDAIPTIKRNHTSTLLTYKGENILVDCGEGTQRQLRKAKLNPCKITKILITHKHGDHFLGMIGLLQTLSMSGYKKTLRIYGPKGIKNLVRDIIKILVFKLNYKIEVEEAKGKFFENDEFYLETKEMKHGVPCNAYSFIKKGQIRIDKEKLKKSKLPMGPLLQKIKQGKNVTYKGKKYLAKNLTYGENDKKISFVYDTLMNKDIVPLVKNSNLLICGTPFHSEIKDKAKEHSHLTGKEGGEIAKKSKVKKLILTHISGRYEKNMKVILDDAKKIFKNSHLVKDLDVIEI